MGELLQEFPHKNPKPCNFSYPKCIFIGEGVSKQMNDRTDIDIITAFNERDEKAISDLRDRYGRVCEGIAAGILPDERDREECVNDALLSLWNAIPPAKPDSLRAYLFTAVRRAALMIHRRASADKREGERSTVTLMDELTEGYGVPDAVDTVILRDALNRFLASLPTSRQVIFLRRYYYGMSLSEIADCSGVSLSSVKLTLSRTRTALKIFLQKEGLSYEEK